MKSNEIRELSIEEILARVEETSDEYTRMRLNHTVSALESPAKIKQTRRTIARLMTILREKEIQELK
ncbi:MAG: 50S ribosomal protein L29 [Bacteroidia bacterium]|nr:50S ribosomal protein L29 [Bacteroidia bacterium]